nr:hypothetical protein [Bacteroidota bacterium]
MKKTFTVVILMAVFQTLNAQLTLTRNDFPMDGDTIEWFQCPDTIHTEGVAGANVTWDLSTLNIQYTPMPPVYKYSQTSTNLTSSIKYGMPWELFYYYIDSTTFDYLGNNYIQPGPGGYSFGTSYDSNSLKKLNFPFTYNDNFTDSFYFDRWHSQYMLPNSHYYGTGFDSTICDGWGTLILPFGIFNALRVYRRDLYNDSNYNGGYIQHISEEYTWYTNNHKCPLLECKFSYNGNRKFTVYTDSNNPIWINENPKD